MFNYFILTRLISLDGKNRIDWMTRLGTQKQFVVTASNPLLYAANYTLFNESVEGTVPAEVEIGDENLSIRPATSAGWGAAQTTLTVRVPSQAEAVQPPAESKSDFAKIRASIPPSLLSTKVLVPTASGKALTVFNPSNGTWYSLSLADRDKPTGIRGSSYSNPNSK